MMWSLRAALMCAVLIVSGVVAPVNAGDDCASAGDVARLVAEQANRQGLEKPEFRITRQDDGQALLYWRYGMDARSFYAVTFRANGCAALTDSGKPRRFVFPKSAYNTGVFEEMAVFDAAI